MPADRGSGGVGATFSALATISLCEHGIGEALGLESALALGLRVCAHDSAELKGEVLVEAPGSMIVDFFLFDCVELLMLLIFAKIDEVLWYAENLTAISIIFSTIVNSRNHLLLLRQLNPLTSVLLLRQIILQLLELLHRLERLLDRFRGHLHLFLTLRAAKIRQRFEIHEEEAIRLRIQNFVLKRQVSRWVKHIQLLLNVTDRLCMHFI